MKNPFEYGGVVGGSAFCNRKKELSDLVRAMENSEKLFPKNNLGQIRRALRS